MAKLIYLDSNVLISFLRDEIDGSFRLLSLEAKQFFDYAGREKCKLILSDLFYKEIKDVIKLDVQSIKQFFSSIKINFEEIESVNQDFLESKKLENLGVHYPDSFHAAIAIRAECDCIVTFNIRDFKTLSKKIDIIEPKNFI